MCFLKTIQLKDIVNRFYKVKLWCLNLFQSLVEEQQSQLNQYECAAGQCVSELQKAQLQVQSLQAKVQESEANNMVILIKTHYSSWICSFIVHQADGSLT